MRSPARLALLPLRCGPELAGVLVVSGLPQAATDPTLAGPALARLERLLDRLAVGVGGHRDAAADLAQDLHRQLDRVLRQHRLVVLGPRLLGHRRRVSEPRPELLRHVRREGGQDAHETPGLVGGEAAGGRRGVDELDERRDRGEAKSQSV